MKISENIIIEQLNILESQLLKLIDSDYVYLDFPGHFNVGDILISAGAFELLKKIPHKCLYRSNSTLVNFSRIPKQAVIILHGGGNFGSLYAGANVFRNDVVTRFPNNKIVFFPQSIYYDSEDLILKDAKICAKHNNLTIIARDNESFAILNKYFSNNYLIKLPDTALGLYQTIPIKNNTTKRILYFKRKDNELGNELFDDRDDLSISDWNDVLDTFLFKCQFLGLKIISKIRRAIGNKIVWFNDFQNLYLLKIMHPYCVNKSIKYFLKYDKVYTTRLHGAILCMLLNIEFEILDTKYKKINNYFNTWNKV